MANKIRVHDEVVVLAGKDKGKRGKVKCVTRTEAIVSGINLVIKHQKPMPSMNQIGAILQKESKIHLSNLAVFNKFIKKPDKIGFKFEKGKKVRFFRSNGETIK